MPGLVPGISDGEKMTENAPPPWLPSLDNLRIGIAYFDKDDKLRYCNSQVLYLFLSIENVDDVIGLSYAELIKLLLIDGNIAGEEAVLNPEKWLQDRLAAFRKQSGTLVDRLADGRWIDVNERLTPEGGVIIQWSDVTQYLQTDMRLRSITASIGEGFGIWGQNNRLELFNEEFAANHGLAGKMKSGMSFDEVITTLANSGILNLEETPSDWVERKKDMMRLPEHQEILSYKDGMFLNVKERRSSDGSTVTVMTDVTDLKKKEAELIYRGHTLEQANADLEMSRSALEVQGMELVRLAEDLDYISRELDMSQVELMESNERAEAANKSKSVFLANMSHEIRTPMNGVIGMVDILSQMDLNPEQGRVVETIRNSSFSLLRIIDDILDASKIEAGKLDLEHVAVRLQPILEGVVETLLPDADKRNVGICLFVDPAMPEWVFSDSVRMRQVLLNLVSNAVKFSRRDEGEEPGRVELRAEFDEEHVIRFTIRDNGIGMSKGALDKLFKPFTQAEESTTRQFGGTGLGLVIADKLVRMMGGAIKVGSILGEGTTFTIRLPFIEAEGKSMSPDVAGLEILALVEASRLRTTLRTYVEAHGVTIQFSDDETSRALLVKASKGDPIIALDLGNMEENERVQAELMELGRPLKFLLFTSQRSDRLGAIRPDCYVVQTLPVLPTELLRAVAVLSGREGQSRVPEGKIELQKAPSVEDAETQEKLVLLVEDNETNQEVIMFQLDMLGYAAEIAVDGFQGLDMWRSGRFSLILTDCHMPEMDGLEMTTVIRNIERENKRPGIPIIAITANVLKGEEDRCLEVGMNDFLSKPVELAVLKEALSRWLPFPPNEPE